MVQSLGAQQEKLEKIEQRKNRLTQQAQSLKASMRKKENALKFTHGGVVKKAGLADLTDTQLLGCLLEQAKRLKADPAIVDTWQSVAETATVKAKKQPVIIKFEDKPGEDVTGLLKAAKLRWNRYAQHWEGDVSGEALDEIAGIIGEGPITRIET